MSLPKAPNAQKNQKNPKNQKMPARVARRALLAVSLTLNDIWPAGTADYVLKGVKGVSITLF